MRIVSRRFLKEAWRILFHFRLLIRITETRTVATRIMVDRITQTRTAIIRITARMAEQYQIIQIQA
mgnify:CR=1 FL=1